MVRSSTHERLGVTPACRPLSRPAESFLCIADPAVRN
jgi:hypothetical protein